MSRYLGCILLMLMGLLLIQGCTVQKRVHRKGWYVSSNVNGKGKFASNTEASERLDQAEFKKRANSTRVERRPLSLVKFTKEYQLVLKDSLLSPVKLDPVQDNAPIPSVVKARKRVFVPYIESSIRTEKADHFERDKGPALSRFWGGFLGALSALIIILPLFLLALILLNGDSEDLIEFIESPKDSPFVKSFKRAFNGVYKVGTAILVWTTMILFLLMFFIVLYVQFGILGVLLGAAFIALMFWLLWKVISGLFDFLFPSD